MTSHGTGVIEAGGMTQTTKVFREHKLNCMLKVKQAVTRPQPAASFSPITAFP